MKIGALIIGFSSFLLSKPASGQIDSVQSFVMCYSVAVFKPRHKISVNFDQGIGKHKNYFASGIQFNKTLYFNQKYELEVGLDLKYDHHENSYHLINPGINLRMYSYFLRFCKITPTINLQYHYGLFYTRMITDNTKYQSMSVGLSTYYPINPKLRIEPAAMFNYYKTNSTLIPKYIISPSIRVYYNLGK